MVTLLVKSFRTANAGRWRNPRVRWTLVRYNAPGKGRRPVGHPTLYDRVRRSARETQAVWIMLKLMKLHKPWLARFSSSEGVKRFFWRCWWWCKGRGRQSDRPCFLRCVLCGWEGNSCSSLYRHSETVCELSRLPRRDQIFKVSDLCCSRVAPHFLFLSSQEKWLISHCLPGQAAQIR